MLLAHISDTHFRSRGEKLYGFIDVNAANADVVSQLNALRERPDAVVVSGDIVNCGRPEEYQVARQILGSLNYPLYLIPGNHDDKELFLEYLHPLCPQLGSDPQNIKFAYSMEKLMLQLAFYGGYTILAEPVLAQLPANKNLTFIPLENDTVPAWAVWNRENISPALRLLLRELDIDP